MARVHKFEDKDFVINKKFFFIENMGNGLKLEIFEPTGSTSIELDYSVIGDIIPAIVEVQREVRKDGG